MEAKIRIIARFKTSINCCQKKLTDGDTGAPHLDLCAYLTFVSVYSEKSLALMAAGLPEGP